MWLRSFLMALGSALLSFSSGLATTIVGVRTPDETATRELPRKEGPPAEEAVE